MATPLDPEAQAYYDSATRRVNETYQMGMGQNALKRQQADQSYQTRMQALQDRLSQEGSNLPNSYAHRGLMNSGVWNYNPQDPTAGTDQMGALQRWSVGAGQQTGALQQQWNQAQGQLDQSGWGNVDGNNNLVGPGVTGQLGQVRTGAISDITAAQAARQQAQATVLGG